MVPRFPPCKFSKFEVREVARARSLWILSCDSDRMLCCVALGFAPPNGRACSQWKLEEVLQSDEAERSPMEQAILSQAMRICYLAIRATEEVWL